jgi:hypothetical protein
VRELNKLIFDTIKNNPTFQSLTGATPQDPRVYKTREPVKHEISDAKPAFAVYYMMGSTNVLSDLIHGAQKNDYSYTIELYGKSDTTLSTLGYIIENSMNYKSFSTQTYIVNLVVVSRGQVSWDDARQLYLETVIVHLRKILTLDEAS